MAKFKKIISSVLLSSLLVSTGVYAGGYHGYGYRHHHGGHWVAPALIGGLVVYSVMQPRIVHPQPVYVTPAPVVMVPPPQPIQAQNLPPVWYYCQSSQTYYPYVQTCQEGWKTVPATPAS